LIEFLQNTCVIVFLASAAAVLLLGTITILLMGIRVLKDELSWMKRNRRSTDDRR
jgi:hypothetical protein